MSEELGASPASSTSPSHVSKDAHSASYTPIAVEQRAPSLLLEEGWMQSRQGFKISLIYHCRCISAEELPSMYKVLDFISSTERKKKKSESVSSLEHCDSLYNPLLSDRSYRRCRACQGFYMLGNKSG
jgi:hypothetical protein